MTFQCPFLTYFDLRMTFPDHKDGLDIHAIRIRIEFGNESYAYHVYLAVFQNYDPKMTSFDLLDDLGWPQETHYWIQNKICSRFICISCEFGNVSDFWPQNDLFDPWDDLEWPRKANFWIQLKNAVRMMYICSTFWPNSMKMLIVVNSDHCFDQNRSIGGFLGHMLYIFRISSRSRFEWY